MEDCEGCLKIKEMMLEMEAATIEHDTTSGGLNTRMQAMEKKFEELEKKVTEKIDAIPAMFDTAIDKMLGRLMRKLLFWGGLAVLAIIVGFARPVIVGLLKAILEKIGG